MPKPYMKNWTKADKQRARAVLDAIAAKFKDRGGQTEVARLIGRSRAAVSNWRQRGMVPPEHIPALRRIAPDIEFSAIDLHPLMKATTL
jgi:hypothetical protein